MTAKAWEKQYQMAGGKISVCVMKELHFALYHQFARAMATDPESLNQYYDMLKDTLKGNGIFNNPLHIYNCDETDVLKS